jgi:hypothetical protein
MLKPEISAYSDAEFYLILNGPFENRSEIPFDKRWVSDASHQHMSK